MNLKSLSDSALLSRTDQLVAREREILSQVLHHLREIERRRLYSDLGYKSLFEYATKRLGYGEDQAARRISAMRLLKELPELEAKISTGALTLSNLSLAQTLFRKEPQSRSAKLELLEKIENKSKREAEKIVLSTASEPEKLRPDRIRTVTDSTIEVRFTADSNLQEKLDRVKGLLAHKGEVSLAGLVDQLCDMAIEKLDRAKVQVANRDVKSSHFNRNRPAASRATGWCKSAENSPAPVSKRCDNDQSQTRPYISASIKRLVWQKARSRCENCDSTHALQIDHINPVALGGANNIKNLRLLCRSCNQRAAIKSFGLEKMQKYLISKN